jgi:hypothetical protein
MRNVDEKNDKMNKLHGLGYVDSILNWFWRIRREKGYFAGGYYSC